MGEVYEKELKEKVQQETTLPLKEEKELALAKVTAPRTLETERLILRAVEDSDFEDLYAYAKKNTVGPGAGWKPHGSLDESREIINKMRTEPLDEVRAIVLKETGCMIGTIGLHGGDTARGRVPNHRMIGYVLDDTYWGKGIMPEAVKRVLKYAFEEKKLDILSVRHYKSNKKSRRVIEKCGFTYEGTLRRAAKIFDESILDCLCYSMLQDEYWDIYGKSEKE